MEAETQCQTTLSAAQWRISLLSVGQECLLCPVLDHLPICMSGDRPWSDYYFMTSDPCCIREYCISLPWQGGGWGRALRDWHKHSIHHQICSTLYLFQFTVCYSEIQYVFHLISMGEKTHFPDLQTEQLAEEIWWKIWTVKYNIKVQSVQVLHNSLAQVEICCFI